MLLPRLGPRCLSPGLGTPQGEAALPRFRPGMEGQSARPTDLIRLESASSSYYSRMQALEELFPNIWHSILSMHVENMKPKELR
ncbi:hypothetical protein MC885_011769 [Smutsia gigantea]|nr:hypothetical protein MC885_011769 [Smutsia gigantea]